MPTHLTRSRRSIRQASIFSQGPAAGADTAVYTLEFAQFLMDQSIGLLGYAAFDQAQQLAQQAKDLRASYSQFDRTPDQVLVQVAAARRQAAGDPGGAPDASPHMNLADTAPMRRGDFLQPAVNRGWHGRTEGRSSASGGTGASRAGSR